MAPPPDGSSSTRSWPRFQTSSSRSAALNLTRIMRGVSGCLPVTASRQTRRPLRARNSATCAMVPGDLASTMLIVSSSHEDLVGDDLAVGALQRKLGASFVLLHQ